MVDIHGWYWYASSSNIMELHLEPCYRVSYKDVDLGIIFVTIPSSAKMQFGWRKYHRFTREELCWYVGQIQASRSWPTCEPTNGSHDSSILNPTTGMLSVAHIIVANLRLLIGNANSDPTRRILDVYSASRNLVSNWICFTLIQYIRIIWI